MILVSTLGINFQSRSTGTKRGKTRFLKKQN